MFDDRFQCGLQPHGVLVAGLAMLPSDAITGADHQRRRSGAAAAAPAIPQAEEDVAWFAHGIGGLTAYLLWCAA